MHVIEGTPTELTAEITNTKPWIDYLHSITNNPESASEFFQAYGQVIAAQVPRRLLLHGPGQLIAACEFSLDLFRSITTTISGLEPGGLEDEHAKIHYHPHLHPCDTRRLTEAVERFPKRFISNSRSGLEHARRRLDVFCLEHRRWDSVVRAHIP